jgi:hypothetical protein
MKKINVLALSCAALLSGCMAPPQDEKMSEPVLPSWNQSADQLVEQDGQSAMVKLESALWFDLMPRIGDEEPPKLKGSLVLSSIDEIPAGVEIESLLFAFDNETWQIDEFELEAISPSIWKVRVNAAVDALDVELMDVAVQLSNEQWLVERGVKVDKVY